METDIIYVLDYSNGTVIRIKLSPAKVAELNSSENVEDFVDLVLSSRGIRIKDCEWMIVSDDGSEYEEWEVT